MGVKTEKHLILRKKKVCSAIRFSLESINSKINFPLSTFLHFSGRYIYGHKCFFNRKPPNSGRNLIPTQRNQLSLRQLLLHIKPQLIRILAIKIFKWKKKLHFFLLQIIQSIGLSRCLNIFNFSPLFLFSSPFWFILLLLSKAYDFPIVFRRCCWK